MHACACIHRGWGAAGRDAEDSRVAVVRGRACMCVHARTRVHVSAYARCHTRHGRRVCMLTAVVVVGGGAGGGCSHSACAHAGRGGAKAGGESGAVGPLSPGCGVAVYCPACGRGAAFRCGSGGGAAAAGRRRRGGGGGGAAGTSREGGMRAHMLTQGGGVCVHTCKDGHTRRTWRTRAAAPATAAAATDDPDMATRASAGDLAWPGGDVVPQCPTGGPPDPAPPHGPTMTDPGPTRSGCRNRRQALIVNRS
jgi:hypothetical protein